MTLVSQAGYVIDHCRVLAFVYGIIGTFIDSLSGSGRLLPRVVHLPEAQAFPPK